MSMSTMKTDAVYTVTQTERKEAEVNFFTALSVQKLSLRKLSKPKFIALLQEHIEIVKPVDVIRAIDDFQWDMTYICLDLFPTLPWEFEVLKTLVKNDILADQYFGYLDLQNYQPEHRTTWTATPQEIVNLDHATYTVKETLLAPSREVKFTVDENDEVWSSLRFDLDKSYPVDLDRSILWDLNHQNRLRLHSMHLHLTQYRPLTQFTHWNVFDPEYITTVFMPPIKEAMMNFIEGFSQGFKETFERLSKEPEHKPDPDVKAQMLLETEDLQQWTKDLLQSYLRSPNHTKDIFDATSDAVAFQFEKYTAFSSADPNRRNPEYERTIREYKKIQPVLTNTTNHAQAQMLLDDVDLPSYERQMLRDYLMEYRMSRQGRTFANPDQFAEGCYEHNRLKAPVMNVNDQYDRVMYLGRVNSVFNNSNRPDIQAQMLIDSQDLDDREKALLRSYLYDPAKYGPRLAEGHAKLIKIYQDNWWDEPPVKDMDRFAEIGRVNAVYNEYKYLKRPHHFDERHQPQVMAQMLQKAENIDDQTLEMYTSMNNIIDDKITKLTLIKNTLDKSMYVDPNAPQTIMYNKEVEVEKRWVDDMIASERYGKMSIAQMRQMSEDIIMDMFPALPQNQREQFVDNMVSPAVRAEILRIAESHKLNKEILDVAKKMLQTLEKPHISAQGQDHLVNAVYYELLDSYPEINAQMFKNTTDSVAKTIGTAIDDSITKNAETVLKPALESLDKEVKESKGYLKQAAESISHAATTFTNFMNNIKGSFASFMKEEALVNKILGFIACVLCLLWTREKETRIMLLTVYLTTIGVLPSVIKMFFNSAVGLIDKVIRYCSNKFYRKKKTTKDIVLKEIELDEVDLEPEEELKKKVKAQAFGDDMTAIRENWEEIFTLDSAVDFVHAGATTLGAIFSFKNNYSREKARDFILSTHVLKGGKDLITMVFTLIESTFKFVYQKYTGHPYMTAEISALVERAEKWVTKTHQLLETHQSEVITDRNFCDAVIRHVKEGQELSKDLMKQKITPSNFTVFYQRYNDLKEYYETAHAAKMADKSRRRPLVVKFFGAPGVGKSNAVTFFSADLYRLVHGEAPPPNLIYYHRADKKYWDNYAENFCTCADDFTQIKNEENYEKMAGDFIAIANDVNFPLEVARANEKGHIFFRSEVVFATSNSSEYDEQIFHMEDFKAFLRRFDLNCLITIPSDDLREKDPTSGNIRFKDKKMNPYHWTFTLYDVFDAKKPRSEPLNYPQMLALMYGKMTDIADTASVLSQQIQLGASELSFESFNNTEIMAQMRKATITITPPVQSAATSEKTTNVVGPLKGKEFLDAAGVHVTDQNLITVHPKSCIDALKLVTAHHAAVKEAKPPKPESQFLTFTKETRASFKNFWNKWFGSSDPVDTSKGVSITLTQKASTKQIVAGVLASVIGAVTIMGAAFATYRMLSKQNKEPEAQYNGSGDDYTKKHKPRRVVFGKNNFSNLQPVTTVAQAFDDQAERIQTIMFSHLGFIDFVTVDAKASNRVNLLFIQDRFALTTAHPFSFMPAGCKFYRVVYNGTTYYFDIKDVCVSGQDDKDVAILQFPEKDIKGVYFSPVSDITHHFMSEQEYDSDLSQSTLCVLRGATAAEPQQIRITGKVRVKKNEQYSYSLDGGSTMIEVSEHFDFNHGTRQGDCGGVYIVNNPQVPHKLLGIHVAGGDHQGIGVMITFEELQALKFLKVKPRTRAQMGQQIQLGEFQPIVRLVEPNQAVYQPSKTEIRPSLIHDMVTKSTTAPCHLRPFKVFEDGEMKQISPLQNAVLKSNRPDVHHPNKKRLRESTLACIEDTKITFPYRELTWDEALNGVPTWKYLAPIHMDTSVGYISEEMCKKYNIPFPEKNLQKGKHAFIDTLENGRLKCKPEFQAMLEDLYQQLDHGPYEAIFKDLLKDERKPKEKVDKGKTRLFSGCPLHHLIILRKLLGWTTENHGRDHIEGSISIGLNVHSSEWGALKRDLLMGLSEEMLAFLCGDFSSFDATLEDDLLEEQRQYVIGVLKRAGCPQSLLTKIYNLLLVSERALHIIMNIIYKLEKNNPSGCGKTTERNGVSGKISMVDTLAEITNLPPRAVVKQTKMKFTGDDHIVSLLKTYPFNLITMKKVAIVYKRNFGMEYTDFRKNEITDNTPLFTLREVRYLKRAFEDWDSSFTDAPLEESVCHEMCNWIRKSPLGEQQATRLVVEAAMREMTHRDQDTFQKFCDLYNDALNRAGLDPVFVDYEATRREYKKEEEPQILDFETQRILGIGNIDEIADERYYIPESEIHAQMGASVEIIPLDQMPILDVNDPCSGRQNANECPDKHVFRYHFDAAALRRPRSFHPCYGHMASNSEAATHTEPVTTTSQLTNFADDIRVETESSSTTSVISPVYALADPYADQGLGPILNRPYQVYNFTWTGSSAPGTAIATLDFPYLLYSIQNIIEKLNKFQYFRAGVKVSIRINATDFHYGTLMCTWLPYCQWDTTTLGSPFENMYTASSNPLALVSANDRSTIEFTIPYLSPSTYLNLDNITSNGSYIGRVVIWVLNKLRWQDPAHSPSVAVSVFAQFINPQVAGPTVRNATSSLVKRIQERERGIVIGHMGKRNKEQHEKTDKGVITRLAERGVQLGNLLTAFPATAEIGAPLSAVCSFVAAGASFFGLSQPTILQNTAPFQPTQGEPLAIGRGGRTTEMLSFDPENAVADTTSFFCTKDYSEFSNYKLLPALLDSFEFTATAPVMSIVARIPICPVRCHNETDSGTKFCLTPLANLAMLGTYWRGGMKFHINISTSKFTSLRLGISWIPDASYNPVTMPSDYGDFVTTIVDITGDTVKEFTIPYLQDTMWQTTLSPQAACNNTPGSSQGFNGILYFFIVNPVTFSTYAGDSTVYMNVFVSGAEDFEIARPRTLPVNYGPNPTDPGWKNGKKMPPTRPNVVAHMSSDIATPVHLIRELFERPFPTLVDAKIICENGAMQGETLGNWKEIGHRLDYYTRFTASDGGVGSNLCATVNPWAADISQTHGLHSRILRSFNYCRGNWRLRIYCQTGATYTDANNLFYVESYVPGDWIRTIGDGYAYYPYTSEGAAMYLSDYKPFIEVEIPYYANVPFVPLYPTPFTGEDISHPQAILYSIRELQASTTFNFTIFRGFSDCFSLGYPIGVPPLYIPGTLEKGKQEHKSNNNQTLAPNNLATQKQFI